LIKPDLIIVHGDRVEALAGAMVGALNNVLVAHVEGGEVSGTVDELIRHSVTKMSHLHFVSHEEAGRRLVQLGEEESSIHVIGSPDMDIMKSPHLPSIESVRAHYEVDFAEYGILLFHPVTTEIDSLQHEITEVLDAVEVSGRSFVAIFPNNDRGSDIILDAYAARIAEHPRVRLFPSISFESMLVMLQNARFVLGNSSMGIREAPFYGIPTINVGTRQTGRSDNQDIINVQADGPAILWAIQECDRIRSQLRSSQEFGSGNSHERFRRVLESAEVWETSVQKLFCDIPLIHLDRSAA
jgi:UDP-N-acetylglucosamine 2-epimerase (hydrolysing)